MDQKVQSGCNRLFQVRCMITVGWEKMGLARAGMHVKAVLLCQLPPVHPGTGIVPCIRWSVAEFVKHFLVIP